MDNFFKAFRIEPYRIFFPVGIFSLIMGVLIWLPQLWNAGTFPIVAHRFLMLNGFSAFFIAGFLMTAVPRFSQTSTATYTEIYSFLVVSVVGLVFVFWELEKVAYAASALQGILILLFLGARISKRKVNPPYSFVFILFGLILWIVSAVFGIFVESNALKNLQYEGAIVAIILGVGSRLIPGILGHVAIVQSQRAKYEKEIPYLKSVPLHFFVLIAFFCISYFLTEQVGSITRLIIFLIISVFYWKIYLFPKDRSALTWNIWISCWLMLMSFLLKALWQDGAIHASHAFFFSGIVLLTLLVATRVLQSHGPKDKRTENYKTLYAVSFLIVFAGATRVSAVFIPASYEHHLGYSSIVLTIAVLLWSFRYLRFISKGF
jgi:hypothetical protein